MTISELEAKELVVGETPVPREAAQRVLDYLIFHRSLLEEPGTPETPSAILERYLGLVQNLKEGVHIVISDPLQKATALLFELVMDEEFDPWEIDLVRFTQVYLERVRNEKAIDFAVVGRLVYMAWSILYLQSEAVLKHRQEPEPDELSLLPGDGTALDDGFSADAGIPDTTDMTTAVLDSNEPPLLQMVRHSEPRPVSLLELVQAFGEAEVEARRSLRIQELRERLREEQQSAPEVIVHGDVPERDLADAWEIVRTHELGSEFPFLELWRATQGRDRLVAMFLAALFLARENSVDLRQERLGETPLLLVRTAEERIPLAKEP